MIAILLIACMPKAPPVYWAEIPPTAKPPTVEVTERDGECPIVDLIPGEEIDPLVVVNRRAQCHGHVISTSKALELTYAEDLSVYWEQRYGLCHAYRQADRATCEVTYQTTYQEAVAARRRGAALEVAVGAAFVVGVALGAFAAQAPAFVAGQ